MIAGIKKCLDAGDIKGLRYIFLDSLDIDPTFENYKDDYVVCRSLDGMFEPYVELTPLSLLHSDWNMDYWDKIKFDQKKNFSEKRFEHMMEVAKVVYADKIERLLVERAAKQEKIKVKNDQVFTKTNNQPMQYNNIQQPIQGTHVSSSLKSNYNINSKGSMSENEIKAIELEYERTKKEELEKTSQREEHAKEIERENALLEDNNMQPKKVMGIVVVIVVIIAVVVLIKKVL